MAQERERKLARTAQPQTTLVLCSAYSLLSTQALDVNNPGGGFGGDGNCARCINLWVACTLAYSPHNQKSNLCVLAYARLNRALNYMHCVKVAPARVASVCFGFCQRGWRRGATTNKQTNKQTKPLCGVPAPFRPFTQTVGFPARPNQTLSLSPHQPKTRQLCENSSSISTCMEPVYIIMQTHRSHSQSLPQ